MLVNFLHDSTNRQRTSTSDRTSMPCNLCKPSDRDKMFSFASKNYVRTSKFIVFVMVFNTFVLPTQGSGIDQLSMVDLLKHEDTHRLQLDTSKVPSREESVQLMEQELPSLSYRFIERSVAKGKRLNKSCAHFPTLRHIEFHNDIYQGFKNGNASFELFGAYYDNRPAVEEAPVIRVLGTINQFEGKYPESYCQLWFEDFNTPTFVIISEYTLIWEKGWGTSWDVLYPHLMTCVIPEYLKHLLPKTVSLVANQCDTASNNLKVHYEALAANETKRNFGVCVKNVFYPYKDVSARLIEWLELMRILGAEKVFIYDLGVHANVTKVFNHYEREQQFVQITRMRYSRGEPNFPNFQELTIRKFHLNKALNELIPFNDCLYRNMYRFEMLTAVDMDEVLMPLGNYSSWQQLVDYSRSIKHKNCTFFANLCFRNTYFPPNPELQPFSKAVPDYFYLLQHIKRIKSHSDAGSATKCFFNTSLVLTQHNHYSMHYLGGCMDYQFNTKVAQLQHYRDKVEEELLEDQIVDDNIRRFQEPVISNCMQVFHELGFFPKLLETALDKQKQNSPIEKVGAQMVSGHSER